MIYLEPHNKGGEREHFLCVTQILRHPFMNHPPSGNMCLIV